MTHIGAVAGHVFVVLARVRRLGALFPDDAELLGREDGLPFVVGLLDRVGRHVFCGGGAAEEGAEEGDAGHGAEGAVEGGGQGGGGAGGEGGGRDGCEEGCADEGVEGWGAHVLLGGVGGLYRGLMEGGW